MVKCLVSMSAVCLLLVAVSISPAHAVWMVDGVALAPTLEPFATFPQIILDGLGGAIITWQDRRAGSYYDIYAQRVDAYGAIQWTVDGIAICTAAYSQESPQIISDGSGGAIITWLDYRSGGANSDIYAQRVNASGAVQWTADGVAICTAANNQTSLQIIGSASGGAIITWEDFRGGSYSDIYAQRVDASGTVSWTADGVAICAAANNQTSPQIIGSGSGSIITWEDFRGGSYSDIYAQRVDASGAVSWTADGVAICAAANNQTSPQIVAGSGGAIITWQDSRYGGGEFIDIFAQTVDASGVVQWTENGVIICGEMHAQESPRVTWDDWGGAIITWEDFRGGSYSSDIYAQRVDASGVAGWAANGVAICAANNNQESPQIASDGWGRVIITWQDSRSESYPDIYAQQVDANGAVQWMANGIAICSAANIQESPQIASDGWGGAIITWQDSRTGSYPDVYAQRVTESGLGPICDVEPYTINFAEAVPVSGARDTSFAITNAGFASLMGRVSEASDHYSIVSGGGDFLLWNGQSRIVTIRYQPTAPGTHLCVIETGASICGYAYITGTAVQLPPDSVIYVDADATGGSGGSSWANAFTKLSDALAFAPSCPNVTQIWVAEGTYRPTADFERTATFQLLDSLAIYGGFAGTETARSQRDVSAHVTILSGDIGIKEDASDNSYHVVTGSGTDATAVLDGFTVTAGKANGAGLDQYRGGGFFSLYGSPTISNIEFYRNEAQSYGGGMCIAFSSPRVINVIFRENRSYCGGGIFIGGWDPILANALFIGNVASQDGGGIYSGSDFSLINASFFGNSAARGGGFCNASGSPAIVNATMWGDSAACGVGYENCSEIYNSSGNPTISYSLVQESGGSAGWDPTLGTDGGHNIDADPLYYGAPAGDLRILVGSTAIDAGNSGVAGLPATDIAGNPRIQGAAIDMGAYEGGTAALFSYAHMDSLVDVPNDQGGSLRIYFTRSSYDNALEEEYPILRYDIHRRVDDLGLLASIKSAGEVIGENLTVKLLSGEKVNLTVPPSAARSKYVRYADRYYLVNEAGAAASAPAGTWEIVGNVSAEQQEHYIRLAPTLADSSSTLVWSVYYISAHTTTPTVHFDSPPDSAYSVDNIAPGVPVGFAVAYNTGSGNRLSWDPSKEGDFQYFKVYRGNDPDFVPAPANRVKATARTEWSDPEYDGWEVYYKITALDHAGNESEPASPGSTTGADDHAIPRSFALHQNAPNPFNPVTVIRYDVPPIGGRVAVTVYDVSGRLVRTLVDRVQSAGQHTVRWDGRNEYGQSAASGIYFCRMTAPGFVEKRKMVLLR